MEELLKRKLSVANQSYKPNNEMSDSDTLVGVPPQSALLHSQLPKEFLAELSCPICFGYFDLPVTLPCGHTCCRSCIADGTFLTKKVCPLCRQAMGPTLCVNTVISGLIDQLGLSENPSKTRIGKVSTERVWWPEDLRPNIALPLFLRVLAEKLLLDINSVDELVMCVLDLFDKCRLWSISRWIMTPPDFIVLSCLIGFDQNDTSGSLLRLKDWMTQYVAYCPKMRVPLEPDIKVTIIVASDRAQRILGSIFHLSNSKKSLPWDCGRHTKSSIILSHFTVSKSHMIFVKYDDRKLGVVDCGSTVGTWMKVIGAFTLKDGDVLSLSGRVMIELNFIKAEDTSPYSSDRWSTALKRVVSAEEMKKMCLESKVSPTTAPSNSSSYVPCTERNGSHGSEDYESIVDGENPEYLLDSEVIKAFEGGMREEDEGMSSEFLPIYPQLCIKYAFENGQERTSYVNPRGTVLGRGLSENSRANQLNKITVAQNNGYVSRDHCVIRYCGDKPADRRWTCEDMSLQGTFLKIRPFSSPFPVEHAAVIKAGHCRLDFFYGEVTIGRTD